MLLSCDYVEPPWDYCEELSHLIQDLDRRKVKRVDRASTLGSDMALTRQYFSCKTQIVQGQELGRPPFPFLIIIPNRTLTSVACRSVRCAYSLLSTTAYIKPVILLSHLKYSIEKVLCVRAKTLF